MKKEQIEKLSLDELETKIKTYKFSNGIMIGLILVMFVAAFLPGAKESLVFKVLPFSFLPLLIINIGTARKLSEELKERQTHL